MTWLLNFGYSILCGNNWQPYTNVVVPGLVLCSCMICPLGGISRVLFVANLGPHNFLLTHHPVN